MTKHFIKTETSRWQSCVIRRSRIFSSINLAFSLSFAESDARFLTLVGDSLRHKSALIRLLMVVHRRIVKQIVQSEFISVRLRSATARATPKAVKVGEVAAAAFYVAVFGQLWNERSFNLFKS